MPAVTLPLTFSNSFWSQDYRTGLETLYSKLEQGTVENDEIVAFIRARIQAERTLADSLSRPANFKTGGHGFDSDDGASLLMTFRGLQSESKAQGEAHRNIANELESLVAKPFSEWSEKHKQRLLQSQRDILDGWLETYESASRDVSKLKTDYLEKTRKADEAEDDAKFAPNSGYDDKYTSSPGLQATMKMPKRMTSVSERITQRLRELGQQTKTDTPPPKQREESDFINEKSSDAGDNESEKLDKGKGKEVEGVRSTSPEPLAQSPPPLSPPLPPAKSAPVPSRIDVSSPQLKARSKLPEPVLLAGVSFTPESLTTLLKRAREELPLRPVRFPIIGEYPDCFSGEEIATWLTESVQGFGGSLDRAEDAARELTERENLLRRVGEFGNKYENNDEAFYQFRPKAFNLGEATSPQSNSAFTPVAENLMKRSNNFMSVVSKAINAQTDDEPYYVRAHREAESADRTYRIAIRKLDRQRLGMEEKVEETLRILQKWELDRLRAIKTALLQFQGILKNLPGALQTPMDRSSVLITSYQPESDIIALVERYRTGSFRPAALVYESIDHEEADVVFGIDLRKWGEGGWHTIHQEPDAKRETIPPVLTALLGALKEAYPKLENDAERRKTWIYEVPLAGIHHLRESINAIPPGQGVPSDLLARYDAPVLASTVKLWLLELNPPVGMWEGWEDTKRLYPSLGANAEEKPSDQHVQDVQAVLLRLPKVHLFVLNVVLKHLKELTDGTQTNEPKDVFITKLALSLGRAFIRPKVESQLSIQDRHPTRLVADLLTNYDAILPQAVVKKKRESDRRIPMPIRKRTAPIDMRLSRSRLSVTGADGPQLLTAQRAATSRSREPSPERPNLPPVVTVPDVPPPPPLPAVPPPPLPAQEPALAAQAPLAPVATQQADSDLPPRPNFVEPPPEVDDAPPRPQFAEPPPEPEEGASPSVAVNVAPPSPRPTSPRGSQRPKSPGSPGSDDLSIGGGGGASLARAGSSEATRLRGPRIARGTRPLSGSISATPVGARPAPSPRPSSRGGERPPAPVNPADYAPRRRGAGHAPAASFSRRTVASDAEDNVVGK